MSAFDVGGPAGPTGPTGPQGPAGTGQYVAEIVCSDPLGDALTVGDGKGYFAVPQALHGMNLVSVQAHVTTPSSAGIVTVQIARDRGSVDMLSTKLTIDANEKDSATAAVAAVIDPTKRDVLSGDELRIDVDVAPAGAKGLIVTMTFQA